jgi:hypothetical protein
VDAYGSKEAPEVAPDIKPRDESPHLASRAVVNASFEEGECVPEVQHEELFLTPEAVGSAVATREGNLVDASLLIRDDDDLPR